MSEKVVQWKMGVSPSKEERVVHWRRRGSKSSPSEEERE